MGLSSRWLNVVRRTYTSPAINCQEQPAEHWGKQGDATGDTNASAHLFQEVLQHPRVIPAS